MRQATNASPTKKGMSTIGEACLQQMAQLSRVRVLLADDFHLFLERASSLLEPAFEIVEKVGDGQSLFEAATKFKPDLIITDLSMPILNGFEAVKRLVESGCTAKIVFLTVNTDPDVVQASLAAGALAYVAKSQLATDLLPAIREALAGRIFISPPIATES
jgi:DNA-binding NarL/FixJ family response regulator